MGEVTIGGDASLPWERHGRGGGMHGKTRTGLEVVREIPCLSHPARKGA